MNEFEERKMSTPVGAMISIKKDDDSSKFIEVELAPDNNNKLNEILRFQISNTLGTTSARRALVNHKWDFEGTIMSAFRGSSEYDKLLKINSGDAVVIKMTLLDERNKESIAGNGFLLFNGNSIVIQGSGNLSRKKL